MKRIFSGAKTPEFPAPPRFFSGGSSGANSPKNNGQRSRSSSFSRIFSGDNSPKSPVMLPQETSTSGALSPELVPIVTLLSAQTHRRYHEGVFLILHDLKNDGSPASRKWEEVYGVLIGTQLALWDAKELAECNSDKPSRNLKDVASKPHYINFTDASLRPIDGSDAVMTESKKKLENAIVVSTTLKNRYFLQFGDKESFNHWNAAIRLSLFEFTSLQEAYTGAFLSSRGAKLGDIKLILSNSKFDYEDWVSVRFGTGMPWKRCYAVISQSTSKKHPFGKIKFFENDKNTKKAKAMATIVSSEALYAVYPSSPLLIDTSTIVKLEGEISFEKKDSPQQTNIFIMPEKHQAVPGYDTIIRFLIPAMNAFKLYGRPKRLIANKDDQSSLLFALPTLPHVHYLKVDDLLPLANSASSLTWSNHEWRDHVRDILQKRLPQGYSGCGSTAGITGALSPVIGSAELFEGSGNITSPTFLPKHKPTNGSGSTFFSTNSGSHSTLASGSPLAKQNFTLSPSRSSDRQITQSEDIPPLQYGHPQATQYESKQATQYADPAVDYKSRSREQLEAPYNSWKTPSDKEQPPLKVNINDSNFDRLAVESSRGRKPNPVEKYSNASELSALYDKYAVSPFGKSPSRGSSPVSQSIQLEKPASASPYAQYVGSSETKTFEISNIRDSASSSKSYSDDFKNNGYYSVDDNAVDDPYEEEVNALEEFNDLARTISQIGIESASSNSKNNKNNGDILNSDLNFDPSKEFSFAVDSNADEDEDNVFDPDYTEQNQMLETDSMRNVSDGSSHTSSIYPSSNNEANLYDQKKYGNKSEGVARRIPHSMPVTDLKHISHPNQNGKQREQSGTKMNHNNLNPVGSSGNQYPPRQVVVSPGQKLVRGSPANSPQYQQFPQGLKGSSQSQFNNFTPQQKQPHLNSQNFAPQSSYSQQAYPSKQPYSANQMYPPQPAPQPSQQYTPQQRFTAQQQYPVQQQYPPHQQFSSQQSYAPGGRSHNKYKNGAYPGQMINPGGVRQQMVSQGPQIGAFPPSNKTNANHKPRPPPNGGFSQFTSSITGNPYAREGAQ